MRLCARMPCVMQLSFDQDIRRLQTYIPRFVAMIGLKAWDKRAAALLQQARGTVFQSYVINRYHWLELELAHLRQWRQKTGSLSARMESAASTSALRFAAACVEIDARLSARGRSELRGRLRDALKSDSGFAPLYLEVLHAVALASHGFSVGLPDLEKRAQYDVEGKGNSARSRNRPSRSRKKRTAQICFCVRGRLVPTIFPAFQAGRACMAGSYFE